MKAVALFTIKSIDFAGCLFTVLYISGLFHNFAFQQSCGLFLITAKVHSHSIHKIILLLYKHLSWPGLDRTVTHPDMSVHKALEPFPQNSGILAQQDSQLRYTPPHHYVIEIYGDTHKKTEVSFIQYVRKTQ